MIKYKIKFKARQLNHSFWMLPHFQIHRKINDKWSDGFAIEFGLFFWAFGWLFEKEVQS